MFIRTRTYRPAGQEKATTYFQLAKCHRVNGKPRQVVIASWVELKELPEAIKAIESQLAAVQAKLEKLIEQRSFAIPGGRYGRPNLGFVNSRIKEESLREKSLLSKIEKLRLALPDWEKFCKIDLSQSADHATPTTDRREKNNFFAHPTPSVCQSLAPNPIVHRGLAG